MKSQYGTPLSVRMNEADVLYLTGLLHAGITDAALLIEAIHQHGEIDVAEK
jgi:hypothetical protein